MSVERYGEGQYSHGLCFRYKKGDILFGLRTKLQGIEIKDRTTWTLKTYYGVYDKIVLPHIFKTNKKLKVSLFGEIDPFGKELLLAYLNAYPKAKMKCTLTFYYVKKGDSLVRMVKKINIKDRKYKDYILGNKEKKDNDIVVENV